MAKSKYTSDDVHALMGDLPNVRNVAMIGPMGGGKTCAIDCLGAFCGLVGEEKIGEARIAHTRQDEKEKGCTMKMSVTSMVIEGTLLHIVDTPGHIEYSAELSVAVPLVDGCLFTVDGNGGSLPAVTTQQVKQIAHWNCPPVLFVNRLDVPLLVTKRSAQEVMDDLAQTVDLFHMTVDACANQGVIPKPNVEAGGVIFGSAAQGWAFTVPQLAEVYAKKMGMEVPAMCERMWGEHYFSPKTKKWSKTATDGSVRAFIQLVLNPIYSVLDACENANFEKLDKMMKGVGVTLSAADKKFEGNALFRRVMQVWMPAGPCITKALKQIVPNPAESQAKRAALVSTAPAADPAATTLKACSKDGALMFHAPKLVSQPSAPGRFYCVGRVFSGNLTADKCVLMDDDYVPPHAKAKPEAEEAPAEAAAAEGGEGEEAAEEGGEAAAGDGAKAPAPKAAKGGQATEKRVQGVVVCMGKTFSAVANVPAGNLCAVGGIDQFVSKRTSLMGNVNLFPFRGPRFMVSPVLKVSLRPTNAKELPKCLEGLRRLVKSCPLAEIACEDSGLHAISGCGEEHMRLLKRDLEGEFLVGIALKWDDPSVAYRETVTQESSMIVLSKSPNKHNRLFVKAEPMSEEVNLAIEGGKITPYQDQKPRSKILEKEFGWDKTDSMKLWGFGPAPEEASAAHGANVIVDQTKGVQYLNEIKESVNSGLLWATKQGPICEENMRGIRFNLLDVKLHADSIHRGMGQIQPTARRVFFAATMKGDCRLVEPIFKAEIDCAAEASQGIMQALGTCRGELIVSEDQPGNRVAVEAFVPIAETIGKMPFATVLSQKTNGKAAVNYAFDHWSVMNADPLDVDKKTLAAKTKTAEIMYAIRTRKGLKVEPPIFEDYYDKL